MGETVRERARDVRLLVLDVDGVLTDGRLYLSPQGEEFKVFHVRDGSGIVAVRQAGIEVAMQSKDFEKANVDLLEVRAVPKDEAPAAPAN